jgi:hypothetical protein
MFAKTPSLSKTMAALGCVTLLASPMAANAAGPRGGGFSAGHSGFSGAHAGGFSGYHGGYGYRGYGYGYGGLAFGLGLGAALAYGAYYPGYYGYYPAYYGYPYYGYPYYGYTDYTTVYDAPPAGYTDPWAYNYGPSYAAPTATAPSPAANGKAPCGKWVWHADQNQYRFETTACS